MNEEWKSFNRYQKIILTIYFIFSLPLMPLYLIMIPFSWWVARPVGSKEKLTLIHFLSMSMAISLLAYMIVGFAYCARS